MYLRMREVGEQPPMLHGSLAGTLGAPPLPPELQALLNRVKRSPQGYEALLLIAVFHAEPWSSDPLKKWIGATYVTGSFDDAAAIQQKVLEELEAIQKQHLQNKDFSALVDKEKLLIQSVAGAFQKRIKELETKNIRWLEDILSDALLTDVLNLAQVGKNFVLYVLPLEIGENVLNSRVPETHYVRIGKTLLLMAQQREKANAAFKRRVEEKRKKQGQ